MKNLVGETYGLLTVKSYAYKKSNRHYWNVECSCPAKGSKAVREDSLIGGHTKSCGCLSRNLNGTAKSEFPQQDISGQVFGRLTVEKFDSWKGEKRRRPYWKCKCSCGKKTIVRGDMLKSGNTQSCGCLAKEQPNGGRKPQDRPLEDLSGRKYNRLKVMKFGYKEKGKFYWLCECLCGQQCYVRGDKIKSGHIKSCGCIQRKDVKLWPSDKKKIAKK